MKGLGRNQEFKAQLDYMKPFLKQTIFLFKDKAGVVVDSLY